MKNSEKYGLNDILGPVTVGPSSSHFTAANKCGLFVFHYCNGMPPAVIITLYNSMSLTGLGHRTHYAILAGLAGIRYDNTDVNKGWQNLVKKIGVDNITIHHVLDQPDPKDEFAEYNANKIKIFLPESGDEFIFYSTGGGNIILASVNGISCKLQCSGWLLFLKHTKAQAQYVAKIAYNTGLNGCLQPGAGTSVFEGDDEKSREELIQQIETFLPGEREFYFINQI